MSLKDWFALVRECPNPWREIRVLRTERDGLIAAGVESDKHAVEWEKKYLDAEKRCGAALRENRELREKTKELREKLLEEKKESDFQRSEKDKTLHAAKAVNARAIIAEERVAELEAQLEKALDAAETLRWIAREGDYERNET